MWAARVPDSRISPSPLTSPGSRRIRFTPYFGAGGGVRDSMISPAPSSRSVSCNCEYPKSSVRVAATTRRGREPEAAALRIKAAD